MARLHKAWRRWLSLCGLAVLLVLTWGAMQYHLHHLERTEPQAVEHVMRNAARTVAARFDVMQVVMHERAVALASDTMLAGALSGGHAASLVTLLLRERLPARWSATLYDGTGSVVAWSGATMPSDTVHSGSGLRWSVATDGEWRQALELWYPIQDTSGVIGQLRLVQLLYVRTPVQNEYLKDYHVADDWSRIAGIPVTAFFDEQQSPQGLYKLVARDGTIVGSFDLASLHLTQLLARVEQQYRSILSLWLTLLLCWVLWFCWRRYAAMRSWRWLGLFGFAWWVARFVLLWINVPGRWQTGKAPLSPLFDAAHMASTLGGGLMRSTGDFLISALFLLLFALVLLRFAFHRYGATLEVWRRFSPGQVVRVFVAMALGTGLVVLLSVVARRAVIDSTLNYLSREALLPEPLILIIFSALAVTALSVILVIAAMVRIALGPATPERQDHGKELLPYGAAALVCLGVVIAVVQAGFDLRWLVIIAFLGAGTAAVFVQVGTSLEWLSIRGVLFITLVVSILLYPLLHTGLGGRRQTRMEHAAVSFDRGYDPSVAFAVRDLLEEARTDSALVRVLFTGNGSAVQDAAVLGRQGALLSSQGAYDVDLQILHAGQSVPGAAVPDSAHLAAFLRHGDSLATVVRPAPDAESGQAYEGVAPVYAAGQHAGWIVAWVAPQVLPEDASTPLLRILLSSGYRDLYASLSLGSFRDGILRRSSGRSFRHYALDTKVADALHDAAAIWRVDTQGDRQYETYYLLRGDGHVVGVRAATVAMFDHLYYLLRLIVAGLMVGALFYLAGLALRRASGMLPAKQVRFQDKMLNAFLAMAIIAVIPVGIVGVRVVTEENTKAIQSWLRNHLQLVEVALAAEARADEPAYRALERVSVDSLAARVGLDINLYEGVQLVSSSRSRLVRDRLTDIRLPIQAYQALFLDGYKFTSVPQQLGSFNYTAGYHALLDEEGRPRYVLSVPTLPEQERIDEERARTLAYLFGALLALMILVMMTASLMASALSQPIARLQQGLRAVAQGRFERRLAIQSRDEVGQLVQTFNEMQHQLAESRRQLTQQERQLAWREMARQVAHEIKNPLTPMKLSLQHLQRSFLTYTQADSKRFADLFDRTTSTLVKEIDSLAHIANEFASFARMPSRIVERLDLVEVMREAATLMRAEADDRTLFDMQLPDGPLVVEADRKELKRIYINLLKNALEAMSEKRAGTITVRARRDGNFVHSAVSDTGCGIAPELREKIFAPSFSTKTSGAGLGLAIARRSIEALNGTIGFETREPGGTVFYIRLPLSS